MHPLSKDLTQLTDEELNKKINALYNRMRYFQQTGNSGSYMQAHNYYLDYQYEFERRSREAIEKLYADKENNFNDKIDIN